MEEFKTHAFDHIETQSSALLETSHEIHAKPELCYEEEFACQTLCGLISDAGLEVEKGAFGLPTAFVAKTGKSGPQIAILCEYDALAEVGHGCGHNIIGTAGAGAGIAAAQFADQLNGRLMILGTPAEEGGGGKARLLENGAFEDVDAAVMIHPANHDLTRMNTLATRMIQVVYKGVAAHSAASPHRGKNALDAAVIAYSAVAALRQHIRPTERIHGIFTEAGSQVNVVPDTAGQQWLIRSDTRHNLERLIPRAVSCFQAGADATGCEAEISVPAPDYFEMWDNEPLLALYASNAALVDRKPQVPDSTLSVMGSTDMGNVSQAVPSIHPLLKVAPSEVTLHTRDFAACAISKEGDKGVLDGAKILAGIAIDFWSSESVREAVSADFQATLESQEPVK